jgi:hypothetical protein
MIHRRRRCGPGSEPEPGGGLAFTVRRCSESFSRVIWPRRLAGAARALRAPGSGVRVTAEVKLAAVRSKGGLLERPYFGNVAARWSKTILAPFKIFNFAAVFLWFKSVDGRLCAAHPRLHLAL